MRWLVASASLFVVVAVVVTWPQAAFFATHASDHHDVYFNMWRFGWFAHAAADPALAILDGNIFFPERRTLTFSDAMPVPALCALPLLWLGLPAVLVHNIVLFAGILLSAVGIFVLARSLTGSAAAGATAGIVFGFAPYRFEHFSHMELQWTVWIPWAFWALERIMNSGRWRDGLALGIFMALQFLSSIYYGLYLVVLMIVAVVCSLAIRAYRRQPLLHHIGLVGGAAAVAIVLCVPYAMPYLGTRASVGVRDMAEVARYSAELSSYLAATSTNVVYGAVTERFGGQEKRLFPGILPLLLAVACVLLRRSRGVLIYAICLVAAFELSLGANGVIYPLLYLHVPGFSALRAPARLAAFVLFFLAILAAFGHTALAQYVSPSRQRVLGACLWIVLTAEYCVAPLTLSPFANKPPALYAWLALLPPGIVAELPMPRPGFLPADDAYYTYMSTFHWRPLVNGYSGYYPRSYLLTLGRLRPFRAWSVGALERTGVKYVIVHFSSWDPEEAEAAANILMHEPNVTVIGEFNDGRGSARVFRLEKTEARDP